MNASNRLLIVLLPVVAAAIAFWVLLLAPKRNEASDLESQVVVLQSQVSVQQQLAANAEVAREEFPRAYRRLVVMGKAAPEDDDTSSLLVQLDRIAADSGVEFVSLQAEEGGGTAATEPAAPQTPSTTAEQSEERVESVEQGGAASSVSAPATEASAALLPIGATIGPAGLPVMKYSLSFSGDFFHLAKFLAGLDEMVITARDGSVGIRGRLITVDSFDLAPASDQSANPDLTANFSITTYLTPAEEGTTGGASPTGPAPATEPQPASTASSASEPTATASTDTP